MYAGVSAPVLRGLAGRPLEVVSPNGVQRIGLPVLLSGADVVISSVGGSGKSLCFLVALVEALKRHEPNVSFSRLSHAINWQRARPGSVLSSWRPHAKSSG